MLSSEFEDKKPALEILNLNGSFVEMVLFRDYSKINSEIMLK